MTMVLLLAALLLVPGPGHAATIGSGSCTVAAVQQAVDQAQPGDTVQLPACRAQWDGTLRIRTPVTLAGQGMHATMVQRAATPATWPAPAMHGGNPMIWVDHVTGFTLRDLTLNGTQDTHPNTYRDRGLWLEQAVDFRVHQVAFEALAIGVHVGGNPLTQRGVLDHNTFTDMFWCTPTRASCLGYGVMVFGEGAWPPLALGTAANVFVEDNTFTRTRHAIASNNGARYVFRHNRVQAPTAIASAIDAHGWTPGWPRGTRQVEIYHNTITLAGPGLAGIGLRGGDGVVFGNRIAAMPDNREIWLLNESGCGSARDAIRDLFVWENTQADGTPAGIVSTCPQAGRDYHLRPRPDYTPYRYPHPLATGEPPRDGEGPRPAAAPRNLRVLSQ